MTPSDLTRAEPQRFNIGAELCAVLRAMRARYDWPRFVGTCGDSAWTWHHETTCELRTWLAGIDATP